MVIPYLGRMFKIVIGIVKRNGTDALFNPDNGTADKWTSFFLNCHNNLTLRKSCRVEITQKMISIISSLKIKRLNLLNDPTSIYNYDEFGFSDRMNASTKLSYPNTSVMPTKHMSLYLDIHPYC